MPSGLPVGVWCGREGPFYPAARELAVGVHADPAAFDDGEHTEGYWRRVLPDALRFIGARLA